MDRRGFLTRIVGSAVAVPILVDAVGAAPPVPVPVEQVSDNGLSGGKACSFLAFEIARFILEALERHGVTLQPLELDSHSIGQGTISAHRFVNVEASFIRPDKIVLAKDTPKMVGEQVAREILYDGYRRMGVLTVPSYMPGQLNCANVIDHKHNISVRVRQRYHGGRDAEFIELDYIVGKQ